LMVFTDVPVTKKPREVRMGKGVGNHAYWACQVRPGTIRYEVAGTDTKATVVALEKVAKKRPVRCRVVVRQGRHE
jgi:large subunit ribosomal protein L16